MLHIFLPPFTTVLLNWLFPETLLICILCGLLGGWVYFNLFWLLDTTMEVLEFFVILGELLLFLTCGIFLSLDFISFFLSKEFERFLWKGWVSLEIGTLACSGITVFDTVFPIKYWLDDAFI